MAHVRSLRHSPSLAGPSICQEVGPGEADEKLSGIWSFVKELGRYADRWGLPKIRATPSGPYNKDYSILGLWWGPSIHRNYQMPTLALRARSRCCLRSQSVPATVCLIMLGAVKAGSVILLLLSGKKECIV